MFRKICSFLCVLLGCAVTLFGYKLEAKEVSHVEELNNYSYSANSYSTSYASFGGDFYTYIYNASDTIVDELDDINHAMGKIVGAESNIQEAIINNTRATDELIYTVNNLCRFLIMAIGCSIFAVGLCSFGASFEKKPSICIGSNGNTEALAQ